MLSVRPWCAGVAGGVAGAVLHPAGHPRPVPPPPHRGRRGQRRHIQHSQGDHT